MSPETGTVEALRLTLDNPSILAHPSQQTATDLYTHRLPAEPQPSATGWISPGNTCTQPTNPAVNSRRARRGCNCKVFADALSSRHGSLCFSSSSVPWRQRIELQCHAEFIVAAAPSSRGA